MVLQIQIPVARIFLNPDIPVTDGIGIHTTDSSAAPGRTVAAVPSRSRARHSAGIRIHLLFIGTPSFVYVDL